MDYAALIAALPAETITAVSGTPQGLTLAAQVEVAEDASAGTGTERALWRLPPAYEQLQPMIGGVGCKYTFELYLSKSGGTNAELQVWADQVRSHFDGRKRPSTITDLMAASVGEMILRDGEHGGDLQCILEVSFIGAHRPGST